MKTRAYIGCKVIRAEPCHLHTHLINRAKVIEIDVLDEEGYEVTYPDGYTSWSPKAVFEKCYRELDREERELVRDAEAE